MRHGKRARGPVIHLTARANDLPYSRVGYAVSRRVGNAVIRNLVKRRLRSIVRELPITPGFDIVAVPQYPSTQASYQELGRETTRSASKLRLLMETTAQNSVQSL
ncbi:MAG: ribonuclease P protein component [Dehalococcoidia bacterium]|nr:ribonuclease P protein component [Dehalococcoidia bacterium]